MTKKLISLAGFFALIITVQFIGSVFTFSSVENWYPTLNKVSWNPPAWVFGPVWTALYILIAISGWLVWLKIGKNQLRHKAMLFFGLQLILNLLWSIAFFGMQSPIAALIDIIFLLIAIIFTIYHFFLLDKKAAILLVPYLLWVSYAMTLNAGIVYLN